MPRDKWTTKDERQKDHILESAQTKLNNLYRDKNYRQLSKYLELTPKATRELHFLDLRSLMNKAARRIAYATTNKHVSKREQG